MPLGALLDCKIQSSVHSNFPVDCTPHLHTEHFTFDLMLWRTPIPNSSQKSHSRKNPPNSKNSLEKSILAIQRDQIHSRSGCCSGDLSSLFGKQTLLGAVPLRFYNNQKFPLEPILFVVFLWNKICLESQLLFDLTRMTKC